MSVTDGARRRKLGFRAAPARYCGNMVPRPSEGDLTVYIDDACAVCAGAARRLARADRHRRLHLRTLGDGAASFMHEDLTHELHAVDARGQVFRGYDAIVAIIARATRLSWMTPLLRSSPARWAGHRCYRFVASRRRRADGVSPPPAL